ncbi:hypothetical protein PtA15_4A189 [Puccinia triticina]|uniref:Uncharacterized protein n=1 Tax=Puccinia triticina TaxID=208348 RepID=A0ABY7CHY5_9BASI|nr:uncharacterized protein PtA15_4A189 [Puccinia triticina]WAQ83741.1 hypothetical protein PtA15_4A189 [Puccinia triticina]
MFDQTQKTISRLVAEGFSRLTLSSSGQGFTHQSTCNIFSHAEAHSSALVCYQAEVEIAWNPREHIGAHTGAFKPINSYPRVFRSFCSQSYPYTITAVSRPLGSRHHPDSVANLTASHIPELASLSSVYLL